MKSYLFTVIIVLLGTAGSVLGQDQQPASTYEQDYREIERLELEWSRMNEISDVEGKRRLLAEDSYHVGPSGRTYNKSQDLETTRLAYEEKQASKSITKFVTTNRNIRVYQNVAVVTLTAYSVTTRDGQERKGRHFRAIHVWEKRGNLWQLTVDQVTGVAN